MRYYNYSNNTLKDIETDLIKTEAKGDWQTGEIKNCLTFDQEMRG